MLMLIVLKCTQTSKIITFMYILWYFFKMIGSELLIKLQCTLTFWMWSFNFCINTTQKVDTCWCAQTRWASFISEHFFFLYFNRYKHQNQSLQKGTSLHFNGILAGGGGGVCWMVLPTCLMGQETHCHIRQNLCDQKISKKVI